LIGRQLVEVPLRDLDWVAHDLDDTEILVRGDILVNALIGPVGGELLAIVASETTEVGDAST